MHRQSTIGRLVIFGVVMLLGLALSSGVASATPGGRSDASGHEHRSNTKDCDGTHHSRTGHGANDAEPHAYDESCDGSPSGNGAGDGGATGKPCAGCVGNADDKQPPGQAPDGPTDHNVGYECDRNQGVGKTNPAHTGCAAAPSEVDGNGSSPPERPKGSDSGNGLGNGDGHGGGNTPLRAPTPTPASPSCTDGCGSTPGSSSPGAEVLSSSEEQTTPDAVLGSAFTATAGAPAPVEQPVVVLTAPVDVVDRFASSAASRARPAEVLGVQLRRSEPVPLALTGAAATANLALVGAALFMVGVALISTRRRSDR